MVAKLPNILLDKQNFKCLSNNVCSFGQDLSHTGWPLSWKSGESQGILTGCLNLKDLPLLRFNLMISVSSKMRYQEVRGISLRSGKSEEKRRSKSDHP